MPLRLIFSITMFASVFLCPWWITSILAVIVLFVWEAYEVIGAGFLLDAVYASQVPLFFSIEYIFTIASILFFITIHLLKKRLIVYQ